VWHGELQDNRLEGDPADGGGTEEVGGVGQERLWLERDGLDEPPPELLGGDPAWQRPGPLLAVLLT
jgi:hypothetical protein